ncbi:MAG: hypothetical protein HY341_01550 [Candidatus Kerfeldbacteria bacterium]|nr:hypothetical protein [Candidatus Kerfeldbacteria bacterium]
MAPRIFQWFALTRGFYLQVQRRSRTFGIVAAALILIIAYLTVIGPLVQRIRDRGLFDLAASRETLVSRKQYVAKLQSLEVQYRGIAPQDIVSLDRILPTEPGIPELYVVMDDLFADAGFTLRSISFAFAGSDLGAQSGRTITAEGVRPAETARALPEGIRVLKISALVTGTPGYDAFKRLIGTIEHSERLVNLTDFTFKPESGEYSFTMETFYWEPGEKPAGD